MGPTTDRSIRHRALIGAVALILAACAADPADGPSAGRVADPDASTAPTATTRTDDPPTRSADDPARHAKMALRRFDGCDAFLDHVHDEAVDRVGAYGFDDQRYWFEGDVVMMDGAMDGAAVTAEAGPTDDRGAVPPPAPTGADGSDSFSGTNVQVVGVDEPDIVKNDGRRVLAISGDRLVYVDIDDGGRTGERRGSLTLSDGIDGTYLHGQELLLSEDRAFVIANVDGGFVPHPQPVIDDVADDVVAGVAPQPVPIAPMPGGHHVPPRTVVIDVDLSDPDDLRMANSLTIDGRYVSARSIDDTVRLVVSTPPDDPGFVYPSGPDSDSRAVEANRQRIRETTLDDWIPTWTLSSEDGTTDEGALVGCDGIHAPTEFAGFDMLSVLTLPMDAPLGRPTATTSVMATGETVYSSQDRMYIATNEWVPSTLDDQAQGIREETYRTGIHRFALPQDDAARYEASGSVEGHLLDQFSMYDQDGTFFVATTTGTPWTSDGSESRIVSMRQNGQRLEQIGVVGGIGKGEQIFSVRYVADTAYVVTFRRTDPFYVVDLSAPTNMAVRGELKIPGVSTYLHPIGGSLVLGVGQEGTTDGRLTGAKVTLFDVSDPSSPREVDVWTLPNANSDAEFDHRAFLWWAPSATAVLPLVSWNEGFAGAVVLHVTEDGITEQGRVTHDQGRQQIVRSMVIGERLWTLTTSMLQANDLHTLARTTVVDL